MKIRLRATFWAETRSRKLDDETIVDALRDEVEGIGPLYVEDDDGGEHEIEVSLQSLRIDEDEDPSRVASLARWAIPAGREIRRESPGS